MTKTEPMGTVTVVDDDLSIRSSVARLLRALGHRVITHDSIQAYLESPHNGKGPACLLLDIRLPDGHGLSLQECLAAQDDCPPIVFITGHGEIADSVKAMKQGAVDFLTKPFSKETLLGAVGEALRKDFQKRSSQASLSEIKQRVEKLTAREHQILRHIIAGALNKQIGYALGIAEKTVKVHRGRVMEKMNVRSVAALVRQAEHIGVTPAEDPD